jgi:membrane protease YdiL (CAAX protease family)
MNHAVKDAKLTKGDLMTSFSNSVVEIPDAEHSPPVDKNKKAKGFLQFFLFAIVMATILIGLKVALTKIPATALLLRQAQTGTMTIPLMLTIDGIGFTAVILFNVLASRIQNVPFSSFGLPVNAISGKRLSQGFAWGILIASLVIGVTFLLGGLRFEGFALSTAECFRYGFIWVLTFIVIALFEETLYRGYALQSLSAALGFWPAAILLSALFGGLHLLNPGETLIGALDVMSYGLVACYTLRRTGNLWFAVGLHAAWNFALTVLYSVPGSGMQAKGHLLRASRSGAPWLTGGSDGPEGSIIGLAVLAASFFAFRIIFQARDSHREHVA